MEEQEPPWPDEQPASPWPRRQAYLVIVEWLDDAHQPESPERLAQAIRHSIEHAHAGPPGTPPARFVVRVKAGNVTSEIEGEVVHRHHHA